jgi:alkane 1-monooxygenase
MHTRWLKYLTPLSLYAGSYYAFLFRGWTIFWPLLLAWVLVPLIELLFKPDPVNLDLAEEELMRNDPIYDFCLYLMVPAQYIALWLFFGSMQQQGLEYWEIAGRVWVMGLLCGTFGINVAHELGHRKSRFEQTLAKMLLLTSQYMHFFIEHNKGHHKRVSTPEDPSSARMGEPVYLFYIRTVVLSWFSAWKIAGRDLRKKGLPALHWKNEMLQFQLIQLVFVGTVYFFYGWKVLLFYLAAAAIGFLLLETVNYIEHYGLERKKTSRGSYERPLPQHSWNSNHMLGRILLFELSRHSDHHYQASRKYQILRHHEDAPQMPTGYPGMMLLSLLPPAWFLVMNPRVRRIRRQMEGASLS